MTGDLGLRGNDLLAYSVIASFSQGRKGCFYGSLADLAEMIGSTSRTAANVLSGLEEKGLIEKSDFIMNGVRRCSYTLCKNCTDDMKNFHRGVGKNFIGGYEKISHNNKSNNDIDKSISKKNNKYTDADFLNDILSLGVEYEDADAWMKVRKGKGGVSSRRAFELTREEMMKSGYTPAECVQVAVLRSWCGIKAGWVKKHMADNGTNKNNQETRDAQRDAQAKATLDEYREKGMI